jgi:hypothetical protein
MTDEQEVQATETEQPAVAAEAVPGDSLIDTVESAPAEVDGAQGVPEWFKQDKYKTVEDQAKAYGELEKRMGAFTGAPDGDYEVPQVEGLDAGVMESNPMVDWFKQTARESGMNQAAFERFVSGYLSTEQEMVNNNRQNELAALGDNAKSRLTDLADWGQGNLSGDQWEIFKGVASTAVGVELLESMIGRTREAKLARDPQVTQPSGHTTAEELRQMRYAKTETGHLRMSVDPEYKKQVDRAYQEAYGTAA